MSTDHTRMVPKIVVWYHFNQLNDISCGNHKHSFNTQIQGMKIICDGTAVSVGVERWLLLEIDRVPF